MRERPEMPLHAGNCGVSFSIVPVLPLYVVSAKRTGDPTCNIWRQERPSLERN